MRDVEGCVGSHPVLHLYVHTCFSTPLTSTQLTRNLHTCTSTPAFQYFNHYTCTGTQLQGVSKKMTFSTTISGPIGCFLETPCTFLHLYISTLCSSPKTPAPSHLHLYIYASISIPTPDPTASTFVQLNIHLTYICTLPLMPGHGPPSHSSYPR